VDEPYRFGIVELENGFIHRLVEKPKKPKTNLAIIGIYFVLRSGNLFDALGRIIERGQRTAGEFQLTDALQELIDGGENMRTFSVDGWYDCGKPETLLETNRVLLDAKNQASADECAKDFPGNIFNGPVYVAPDAEIENSIIGPYVAVATKCVIRNSIIRDSILSSQARVEEMVLDQSIISDKALIAGEAYRLSVGDSSEIRFGRVQDEDAS
jgi:glucose-1-phosphate thymidylyltransferase